MPITDIPSSADVQRQLKLILSSSVFHSSERMSTLLAYVVAESLHGRSGSLKEIVIGRAVLQRGPEYDPKLDPTVRVEMRRLRTKLAEYYQTVGSEDGVIVDIPKGGYTPTFKYAHLQQSARTHIRRPFVAIAAGLVVLIAGLAVVGTARIRAGATSVRSIAILPLADLSPDGGGKPFGDGLSAEIIQELSESSHIRVPSFAETARMGGSIPRQVADLLAVDAVLEGSIRVVGSHHRIALRFLRDGTEQVWSHTFEREGNGVLAIQREIARAVLNRVQPLIGSAAIAWSPAMEARDLYWRGKSHQYNGQYENAAAEFERALAIEPGYALAYAALGQALGGIQMRAGLEDFGRAIATGTRAAEIDPRLAEAHVSLGITRSRMFDWNGAEAEFKRAIAIDEEYAPAHGEYAQNVLLPTGRLKDAIAESRRCMELDPASFWGPQRLGKLLIFDGQHDLGMEELQKAIRLEPKSRLPLRHQARSLIMRGRALEAIALLGKDEPDLMAIAHYLAGRRADAALWSEQALTSPNVNAVERIVLLANTGRIEEALTAMEDQRTRRSLIFSVIAMDPLVAPIRDHPRFKAVLRSAGIPI